MVQCRYDLKEMKNYRPLELRKDRDLPTNWHEMQKNWPKIDWDTKIFVDGKIDINLDKLPEIEKLEASISCCLKFKMIVCYLRATSMM